MPKDRADGVARIFREVDHGITEMRIEAELGAQRYAKLIGEWADAVIRERTAELSELRDEIAERPEEVDESVGRLRRALIETADALQKAA
jgi:hypothetical protein